MRLIFLSVLLLALPAQAEEKAPVSPTPEGATASETATPAPQWYLDDIAFLTRDGGRWAADNSQYQGDDDPFDAYVIEWKAGYAYSMSGRLFGLKDGEETGDFWEMFQYWDPGKGEAVVTQFGFGKAVGLGRAWVEDGVSMSEQRFYAPDGSISGIGHKARNPDANTHVTESFDIVDGAWKPRRTYTWKRQAAPEKTEQNTE